VIGGGTTCIAFCDGGYTTNLPLADLTGGKAWVAFGYDGAAAGARARRTGPPPRAAPVLLEEREVGARAPVLLDGDRPGFWEQLGYHDRGDPWREQRYQGDP
jgi:DMSO/TMAO reductase YedYZ molybdopterin-dependent catalytic subunit